MQEIRFYKDKNDVWYADIPQYLEELEGIGASKEDLAMILGADKFLEELCKIYDLQDDITLILTPNVQEIRSLERIPAFAQHNWEYLSRADYIPTASGKYYTGYNQKYIWLCDVTLWVFGEWPTQVYYKVVKNNKNEDNKG